MNKKILSYAAPIAGAIGGNFLGDSISNALGVSPAVGAGIGAGLGGFGGSLASGTKIGRAVGTGAITGLGAGVLRALSGGPSPSTAGGTAAGAGAAGGGAGIASRGALPSDLTAELGISPGQAGTLNNAADFAGAPGEMPGTELSPNGGFRAVGSPSSIASAAAPVAAAATKPGGFDYNASTLGKIFNQIGLPQGSITEGLAKNPNLLLAGGGLAANMAMGSRDAEGMDDIRRLAARADQRGERMSSYLDSGTLPAGAQAGLTQATEAAKAAIRSKYASMNMSGSSAEMQELNDVDSRAQAQGFQMASNLMRSGVEESGIAANLYNAIMRLNAAREAQTGQAISAFASALNG